MAPSIIEQSRGSTPACKRWVMALGKTWRGKHAGWGDGGERATSGDGNVDCLAVSLLRAVAAYEVSLVMAIDWLAEDCSLITLLLKRWQ